MVTFFIIIFALTLIYLTIAERFQTYVTLIAIQGLLLFGISFFELSVVNWLNLAFIATETLIFKAIVFPIVLSRLIKTMHLDRVHIKTISGFYSLLLLIGGLIISILLSFSLAEKSVDAVYFTMALFTLYSGILVIVTHKRIFSHLVGFLVIENAVFLFSMAVGSEMPMLINSAILLDIIVSVLILGVFISKIGNSLNDLDTERLTKLKD